ncbi:MAG: hypothetical protein ACP5VR_06795 [Acidimicrobiales bacterium]
MAGDDPRDMTTAESDQNAAEEASGQYRSPEDYDYEEEEEGKALSDAETVDEQGRRHVRRAAPEGTQDILEADQPRTTGLPDKIEAWRRRSATGAVLTAFALGLQEALEPERKEPAIVMQTSGDPPKDLPVEAQLEQLGPRQSTISVRPWLLGNQTPHDRSGTDAEDK